MTNDELRMTKETRMTNPPPFATVSGFVIHSSFVIRHSSFPSHQPPPPPPPGVRGPSTALRKAYAPLRMTGGRRARPS